MKMRSSPVGPLVEIGEGSLPEGVTGDILYKSELGWVVLPIGSEGHRLLSDGTIPYWEFPELPEGTLGDILYRDESSWVILPIGTNGHVLSSVGGLPGWAAAPGGGSGSVWVSDVLNVATPGGAGLLQGATVAQTYMFGFIGAMGHTVEALGNWADLQDTGLIIQSHQANGGGAIRLILTNLTGATIPQTLGSVRITYQTT